VSLASWPFDVWIGNCHGSAVTDALLSSNAQWQVALLLAAGEAEVLFVCIQLGLLLVML
jgi:hypothetical protein